TPTIPGEDPAHFEALRTSHYDRFQPATPEELVLVATMVRDAWSLECCSNSETATWTQGFDRHKDGDHRLARVATWNRRDLTYLQLHIDSAQRNYRRNLELLIKLQTARRNAAPAPEPIAQPKSPQPLAPVIGLVPATRPSGPPST